MIKCLGLPDIKTHYKVAVVKIVATDIKRKKKANTLI